MNKDDKKVWLAYLAVCFFWGSTYLAIRIGVRSFPPLLFAGIRFIISGSLMLLYLKLRGVSLVIDKQDISNMSIVGLLMLLGGNGLVVYAEQWVNSGIASLIIATSPLFMTVIEYFFLRNIRIDWKAVFGLIMGFGGVSYLMLGDSGDAGVDVKGLLLLLLASFFWATGSIHSKKIKFRGHIFANIGVQMLAGGIGLMLTALLRGELAAAQFSLSSAMALMYLITFGSFVAYSSYIYILQKWTAAKAGTYAYINPVVAVILGALILGEPLTPSIAISMVIVIAGVVLVQSSKTNYVEKKSSEQV